MTTKKGQAQSPEQRKEDLSELRSDWFTFGHRKWLQEIERGEYQTIKIYGQKGTYRAIE